MQETWLRNEEELFTERHLEEINAIFGLEQDVIEQLRAASKLVRAEDTLWKFLLECQLKMYGLRLDPAEFVEVFRELPASVQAKQALLEESLGTGSGLYAVLLVVLLLDWTKAYYRSLELPQELLLHTMDDLRIWMKHYEKSHGAAGLDNLPWLLYHIGGRLFRLGRLQFVMEKFRHPVKVLRNKQDKEDLIVLSEAGVEFRSDGLVNGTNRKEQSEGSWTAAYKRTDKAYIGHVIRPDGTANPSLIEAPGSEYELALERDNLVLDVHIPEGSRMSRDACIASMKEATAFYRHYFPNRKPFAFTCSSWLLDAQFEKILPATSNIVNFQRLFHLFPLLSDEGETYSRVFGSAKLDRKTASRDTGLRRAILDYADDGGMLHGAGGFRLLDEPF
ncbi:acyltransferase domain-containing protein [Paenibacillus sp. HB172176]|uniref:acyltransferase domain-containing protein n=1 Tax=Paenibacillus sp. HB172176 TaxID=2493690 RepID=UPI00143B6020|nr:acyltransferase domain-containing protein [Paenibacillus sp. HB172176]